MVQAKPWAIGLGECVTLQIIKEECPTRKIFLAIFLCTVLFTFVRVNSAWAYSWQVHIPAATPFHPDKHSGCTTCHTSRTNPFTCTDCHATNTPVPNATSYSSPSPPVVKYDSPVNQSIHSNYTSNTDACASCHATHIAVGSKLLKWVDSTTACLACHDGTVTSTYDVKAGQIGTTGAKTSGGKFGVTMHETGLSYHNVLDICATSAAPGGAETQAVADSYGVWNTPLNCIACHDPHGQGGNSRILNPDPNGIAMQNRVSGETLTEVITNVKYSAAKQNWIPGYPYASVTKIYAGPTGETALTAGYTINYATGEVEFSPALTGTNIVRADYVPGVSVKMEVMNKLTVNESVAYMSGINKFCGACHTDYETSSHGSDSGHTLTGVYRSAYRHGVGMLWDDKARGTNVIAGGVVKFENVADGKGTIMCLTCHYAHGTDDAFVGGTTYDTGAFRFTALKRQVNMGVCETCHQK